MSSNASSKHPFEGRPADSQLQPNRRPTGPLTDDDLDWLVREAYAVHQAYFAAGISPDHVYVQVCQVANAAPPGLSLNVLVWRGGVRKHLYTVGPFFSEDDERFRARWLAFAERKKSMTHAELDALCEATHFWQDLRVAFYLQLIERGLALSSSVVTRTAPN